MSDEEEGEIVSRDDYEESDSGSDSSGSSGDSGSGSSPDSDDSDDSGDFVAGSDSEDSGDEGAAGAGAGAGAGGGAPLGAWVDDESDLVVLASDSRKVPQVREGGVDGGGEHVEQESMEHGCGQARLCQGGATHVPSWAHHGLCVSSA